MYHHLILFEFHDHILQEQINRLFLAIANLKIDIPEIIHYSWGNSESLDANNKCFSHGFTMAFNTRKDYEAYQCHPKHVELVATLVCPIMKDAVVFNYADKSQNQ